MAPAPVRKDLSGTAADLYVPLCVGEEGGSLSGQSPSRSRISSGGWKKLVVLAGIVAGLLLTSCLLCSHKPVTLSDTGSAFELVRQAEIPSYNFTVRIYRHKATGAEVLSIITTDVNKAGAIVLRTPVTDDKGKPHVLEHCLLGGSRKYPAKAPPTFDRLNEQSLATFLNAETYADRTLFPVSSTNLKDFYNLMDVYLDAMFNPLVLEEPRIFKQEAWHYKLEDADHPEKIEVVGVVLNEMTGAMSDPSAMLHRAIDQNLFPNATYSFNSGGMPMVLPELLHEEVVDYYREFYHPSNARFWFYGDDPEEERLGMVNRALDGYAERPSARRASEVAAQPPFESPRAFSGVYPSSFDGDKGFAAVAWVLSNGTRGMDPVEEMAFHVLQDLLLGHETSPLRAALTNSGLGTRVWKDSGLDEEEKIQPSFLVGMVGVEPEDAAAVHSKIMETLEGLAENGFEEADIQASLNRIEMKLRLKKPEDHKFGVTLLEVLAGKWVWERDILEAMDWEARAKELERKVELLREEGTGDLFADLIRRFLLANPHRLSVTFAASREAAREQQEAEARALARAAAQRPAGSKAARDLVADCSDLALWQTTPDTPEAVAAVPTLSFKDVSREVPTWVVEPRTEEPYRGTTLMEAEEEMTGELIYAALALDLGQSVPPEDIVLLPVLAFAMDLLGFRGGTALERQRKEFTHCAGIQYLLEVGSREGEEDLPAFHLIIEGGAKSAEAPLLLSLLRRALLDVDFRSAEAAAAVRSYVTSAITGMQRDFQDNALEWVRCHTAAMMTPVGWIRAQLEGFVQLEHLLKLKEDLGRPGGYDRLAGRLEELAARLPYQHGTVLCLTGREKSLADARGAAIDLLDSLKPRDHLPPSPRRWNETEPQGNHALLVGPNTNNNIASQARVSVDGSALAAVQVLNRYLLIEVRMKGGAYGAYAEVDQVEGVLELSSYRDPNLEDTLSVFRGAAAELRRVASDMDPDRLESAILGGLRDLQAYDPPADRGYQALIRFLRNTSVASMQAQRDELFETKPSQLADLADAMDDAVFVTVAAAPEDQARGVVNPDGTPFFVKLIDADAYFRDS